MEFCQNHLVGPQKPVSNIKIKHFYVVFFFVFFFRHDIVFCSCYQFYTYQNKTFPLSRIKLGKLSIS